MAAKTTVKRSICFYLTDEECKCVCKHIQIMTGLDCFYLTDEECKFMTIARILSKASSFYLTDEECKFI